MCGLGYSIRIFLHSYIFWYSGLYCNGGIAFCRDWGSAWCRDCLMNIPFSFRQYSMQYENTSSRCSLQWIISTVTHRLFMMCFVVKGAAGLFMAYWPRGAPEQCGSIFRNACMKILINHFGSCHDERAYAKILVQCWCIMRFSCCVTFSWCATSANCVYHPITFPCLWTDGVTVLRTNGNINSKLKVRSR